MTQSNVLRLVFHARAKHQGCSEIVHQGLVDLVTEILNRTLTRPQNNRVAEVRQLALRLRVHSHQLQSVPHHLQQLVQVPSTSRGNWNGIWNSVQQVQLLDRKGVDLVQNIDRRNVSSVADLNHVDQIVHSGITPELDVT
ncbi:hypothetical protein OGAPHI_003449 [Ogataea philodendri]|uniref:Uncharacterized protein n=1 Tax=Ogataea philodendri TaxID=1378263 RepID=A0A9P8T4Y9_9ASCO|nr:uncharacterized protein OGAPHI_003449 [Ogataea philodendri]KAH3666453.1 hypothetical protein OGAPHI_003449 [Ogataea philodendri]